MADNPRKPVVGSRNPTGRPRKIAGQRQSVEQSVEQPVEPEAAEGVTVEVDAVEGPPVEPSSGAPAEPGPPVYQIDPSPEPPPPRGSAPFESRTTAIVLSVLLVLLLVAGGLEVRYLWFNDEPTESAARPVVTGELSWRVAVEAAATSTEEILSTSYKNYDEQVEQATAKMTDTFADEYRQTSDDIKDQFVASETELQVEAVAQGVVRASSEEVQALLFLNQYVQKKDENGQPKTDYAQYRALVTVVHTDHGWLVSKIETQ
jgi:Mce-associated membrane protein